MGSKNLSNFIEFKQVDFRNTEMFRFLYIKTTLTQTYARAHTHLPARIQIQRLSVRLN